MALRGYREFVGANRRFLGFGFCVAFVSSFGQTYFVGVFGPALQGEFGLSHTAWGSVYMAGTLASAAVLPWTGKQIDRFDLRGYTLLVCLGMALACAVAALAAGPLALVGAVFLLRQFGQGLLSHVAVTSMARYFDEFRGRGVAVASLGFSVGETCLPFAAVLLIGAVGWRQTYGLVAALVLLVALPFVLWLLRGHGERHRAYLHARSAVSSTGASRGPSWTRAQVVRDLRFYLLLPGLLSPSLILTALFFHHLNLADEKGWSHAWITGNYVLYAAAAVVTMLVAGPLIDRHGALRMLPAMLAPLALGLLCVSVLTGSWVVWPYLTLIGVATGLAHTLGTVVWAELYGVAHLGAIKSLAAALSVLASSLGPVSAGALMDRGVSLERVCLVYVAVTVVGVALVGVAMRRSPAQPAS